MSLSSDSVTSGFRLADMSAFAVDEATKPMAWGRAKPGGWGQPTAVTSLQDVMSEELARELQAEEDSKVITKTPEEEVDLTQFLDAPVNDTDNDLLLAQILQHEFNVEHDCELKREETHVNKNSKVTLSFANYRSADPVPRSDSDESADDDDDYEYEMQGHELQDTSKIAAGKHATTKHDADVCALRNAHKFMTQFPLELVTGDDADMRLPNHVYNSLKLHVTHDNKRRHRLHEKKEHSTAESAVDEKTRLILYKLLQQDILREIGGVISTGKEAVVLHATGGSTEDIPEGNTTDKQPDAMPETNTLTDATHTQPAVGGHDPVECAVKVFKTTLTDFRNRAEYVQGDVRFFRDQFRRQNLRKVMKVWAEKEAINLRRMRRFGIACPRVIALRKHILVMTFIGSDQRPSPQLKEAKLSTAEVQLAYEQCLEAMHVLYRECLLVHADLSEYNLLWNEDEAQLYVIDVGQAVDLMHPHASRFLLRDCTNVCKFFTKAGVPDVPTPYKLFNDITGRNFVGEGEFFLQQVEDYEKRERELNTGKEPDYPFDFFFEKAQGDRTVKKADEQQECDQTASEPQRHQQQQNSDDCNETA